MFISPFSVHAQKHIKLAVILLHLIILVFYSVAKNSFVMSVLVSNSNYAKCCFMLFSGLTYLPLVGTGNFSRAASLTC